MLFSTIRRPQNDWALTEELSLSTCVHVRQYVCHCASVRVCDCMCDRVQLCVHVRARTATTRWCVCGRAGDSCVCAHACVRGRTGGMSARVCVKMLF